MVAVSFYLIFQTVFIGLQPFRVLVIGLFLFLFFLSRPTRNLSVALVPFIIFGASYDWMRLIPNYKVRSVDILPLYTLELNIFGITDGMNTLIPSEYFYIYHNVVGDVLSGLFYLCWVPVPILFGIYLFTKNRKMYIHFSCAFLFVNLLGFVIYYLHPAAPPWYVMNHRDEPFNPNTKGNPAGLVRFDEAIGIKIFSNIYGENANVFAAIPSLHSAYLLIAAIYGVLGKCPFKMVAGLFTIAFGIWFSAVYTAHHYVIDVLCGIACTFVGIYIFEGIFMKSKYFRKFIDGYTRYVSSGQPEKTAGDGSKFSA